MVRLQSHYKGTPFYASVIEGENGSEKKDRARADEELRKILVPWVPKEEP